MVTYKRCKKCGRDLPLSAFDYSKRSEDGYMIRCRECNKIDAEKKKPVKSIVSMDIFYKGEKW